MSRTDSIISTAVSEKSSIEKITVNKFLAPAMAKTLSMIVEDNKKLQCYAKRIKDQRKMVFSAKMPPSISLLDFIQRIEKYTEVEESTLIISMIYIDRLCAIAKITLTPLNIHRIIIGSVVSATKYNEDSRFSFEFIAKVSGVTVKELEEIESSFLGMIHYTLYVDEKDYEKYSNYLTLFLSKDG